MPDEDLDPAPAAPRGRGRGRRREARFELEFGDFEPAERRTTRRTGDDRYANESGEATYETVDPLPRPRRPRDRDPIEEPDDATYDSRLADRDARVRERVARAGGGDAPRGRRFPGRGRGPAPEDEVADEIEALERFEDAIETVRTTSDRGGGSDLGARVLVAIPAAAVAIFLVAQGGPIFAVGVAAFGLIGVWELTRMFARTRPSVFAAGVGVVALIAAAAIGGQADGREAMVTALAATIPLIFVSVALARPAGGMPGVAVTLLGVVWIGLALAHAVLLRDTVHGGGIVVDVLVGTFLGDTGAYLGGRLFGSHKLAPRISPNKTVEGLVIGMFTAVVAVWFAGLYQDWLSGTDALLLGLAVAIAAPVGDLFESFLKRDAGTKDAGVLFGAHGGVLDRLDAAMFAIVAGYYVWLAMGVG
ncbi:phosphatidate cytidylyltransferase [Patulibacter defluvii]|uniref:phosphatidate cytidylyltransferase n=1 Tax=Patulibacter defluvii TaxID=3095358 RepID=UPI002A75B9DC|nr:phosphatidate cytidylyltransferase [Patulibacter sp. DM4]